MSPAEVLNKAADLIEERGLATENFVDLGGCLCAWGAVLVALGAEPEVGADYAFLRDPDYPRAEPVLAVLSSHLGLSDSEDVPSWNDDEGRTKDEVIAALRAAAGRAA